MTFTEKELDGAALQIAAEAMGGIPRRVADFLTESQTGGLMNDIRTAARESLEMWLTNYIEESDEP